MALWCNWLTRRPLKAKSSGSSPDNATKNLRKLPHRWPFLKVYAPSTLPRQLFAAIGRVCRDSNKGRPAAAEPQTAVVAMTGACLAEGIATRGVAAAFCPSAPRLPAAIHSVASNVMRGSVFTSDGRSRPWLCVADDASLTYRTGDETALIIMTMPFNAEKWSDTGTA